MTNSVKLHIRDLGVVAYNDALLLQRALCQDSLDNYLLLCEHNDVITLGKHAREEFLLETGTTPVIRVERGGEATWHGRGQVVGYPIVLLNIVKADSAHMDAVELQFIQNSVDGPAAVDAAFREQKRAYNAWNTEWQSHLIESSIAARGGFGDGTE